jgi:2-amino-4-hydroxy-6-hydroxymethyldihydropteridine diphosphokinase
MALSTIEAVSNVYETEPVGPQQPLFWNMVARVRTTLDPAGMLDLIKRIEVVLGRESTYRWGPRTIDIDILLWGNSTFFDDDIRIPHPEMMKRGFVLHPLHDVDADLVHPITGERIDAALDTGTFEAVRALFDGKELIEEMEE